MYGISLLTPDSDCNRRLAMLSIDNAVELTIKTFLSLPEEVTGVRLGRKDYEQVSQSFPGLLTTLRQHASDKLRDYNVAEIEWYHRLRNQLYHQGNGLTVDRKKVEAYAAIARGIFIQLFGCEPQLPSDSPGVLGQTRKGWFFTSENEGKYFAATANAKGSCSLRLFDAPTGQFLKKEIRKGDYQDAFERELRNATALRIVKQPNLERDCRGGLPPDTLKELQQQVP